MPEGICDMEAVLSIRIVYYVYVSKQSRPSGFCCYVAVKSVEVFLFYQMRMGKGVNINLGICGMWLGRYIRILRRTLKMGLQH